MSPDMAPKFKYKTKGTQGCLRNWRGPGVEEMVRVGAEGFGEESKADQITPCHCVSGAQGDGDKVMRGAECEPHSQPWQVALFERGRFNCGGSLIAPNWVLSAAHCQTR